MRDIFYLPNDDTWDYFASEMGGFSDRAVAIVAAALLDDRLKAMFASQFCNEKASTALLSGSGPLSTFAARIDLGGALRYYSPNATADLHRLRRIRNMAAHQSAAFSFEVGALRDIIMALLIPDINVIQVDTPSGHLRSMIAVKDIERVRTTPKLRYISACLFFGSMFGANAELSQPIATNVAF